MVNFNIGFTADTTQAKRAIAELTRELNNISHSTSSDLGFAYLTNDLTNAKVAAAELREHLRLATNVDTGKLDLRKLNSNMQKSNSSLASYVAHLQNLGPAGHRAFNQLTNSILSAEVPAKRLNKLFSDLLISLKNTISWQISSSVLMGFTGAISSAYNYAKDLNESLNNIRIVTSQSTEQMAKFAKEANKAAKSLSTTTTAYTDAALIYYQQGLTGKEVVERTNATIKMANVTGENAQNVSSYMTAIWNNFDDGSKSLEYYADVITALGAATASSSEEIAGGLEKFAAIGQTVGLSYEYATAALATVVSETRQSEDVVGTSFKTIFARLQGLQQGKEQEDGVTLNKYSAALKSVGIDIIETNGELKAMDDILNELGNKWETLGEAEKVALAQTVGGVRQYTQLISLMENWDTFQDNLNVAYNSEGSLEEQSQIYEESWAAATNRITAALEEMWNALINDEAFIKFFDIIADFIDLLDNVIDGLGGFKGLLTSIGAIATKVFEKQMVSGLENLRTFLTPRKILEEEHARMQRDSISLIQNANRNSLTADLDNALLVNKLRYLEISKNLNDIDKFRFQTLFNIKEQEIENLRVRREELEIARQELALRNEAAGVTEDVNRAQVSAKNVRRNWRDFKENINNIGPISQINDRNALQKSLIEQFKKYGFIGINGNWSNNENLPLGQNSNLQQVYTRLMTLTNNNTPVGPNHASFINEINQMLEELRIILNSVSDETAYIQEFNRSLNNSGNPGLTEELIRDNVNIAQVGINVRRSGNAITGDNSFEELMNRINAPQQITAEQNLTTSIQALTSALGLLNSAFALYDTWTDDSISTTDKLTASVSSLASSGMQAVYAFNSFRTAFKNISEISNGTGIMGWLGKAGPWITAIIAGLYIFLQVVKRIQDNEKKNSVEERTKRLTEETNKLKSSYDNLRSSINNLSSARETLKDLTEGTIEWKEAVLDINQQVLDLLTLYPQLAQFITNDNGVLSLSSAGLDALLEEQQKILETSQMNLFASEAERAKKMSGSIQDIYYNRWDNSLYGTHNGKNPVNLASGTSTWWQPPVNANQSGKIDIGDAVGLYRAALAQDGAFGDNGFNFDKFTGETKELYDKIVASQNLSDKEIESFQKALNDAIPNLGKLSDECNAAAEKVKSFKTQSARIWMDNNNTQGNKNKDFKDVYAEALAIEALKVVDEQLASSKFTNSVQWYDAYAQQTGLEATQVAAFVEQGTLTLENIQTAVKENERFTIAEGIVSQRLSSLENLPNDINDVIKKIILSGGDESSYNALLENERKALYDYLNNGGLLGNNLDQTFIDKLIDILEDVDTYTANSKKNRREKYDANAEIVAQDYGMDLAGFKDYQLKIADKDELEGLNDLIKENNILANEITDKYLKWDKGAKKVNETLEDTKDAIINKTDAVGYKQALNTIAESLTSLFGFKVSSKFVDKYYKEIKKAFEKNDSKAIKKYLKLATIDYTINLKPELSKEDKASIKQDILGVYDELNQIGVGELDFDNVAQTGKLEAMLLNIKELMGWGAEEATEEFNKMFDGLEIPEIKTKTYTFNGKAWVNNTDGIWSALTGSLDPGDGEIGATLEVPYIEGTGKNKGQGGSGGGGKKPSGTKKDKKKKSDEIEQFHKEKRELERLSKELDEIDRKKNRAFGKGKLKLYDEEIEKLKELRDAQKDLVEKQRTDLEKKKTGLEKYGVQIDPVTGEILNYEEVYEKQISKFNKKRTEKAEKEYEEFKKKMEEYEKALDELKQNEDEYEKYLEQIHDEGLEAVKYKVEYQVELNDSDMKFLDYFLDKLSDNIFDLVDKIDLIEGKMLESLDNYSIYLEGVADVFRNLNELRGTEHSPFADLTEDDISKLLSGDYTTEDLEKWGLLDGTDLTEEDMLTLNQYKDSLLELAKDLADYQADVYNTIVEAADAVNEEYDKQIGKLEHLFNLWDHFKNIVELTGKASGITDKMMLEMNRQAVDAKIGQVFTKSENLKTLQSQLDDIEKDLIRDEKTGEIIGSKTLASTSSSLEDLKRNYEDLQAKVREAKEELLSSWQDALTEANNYFQASVELVIKGFEEAMSGTFGSLERLQDAYGKQKELNDFYLDDYKQIYELTKLTRDITKSIDETDNIASKNKLKEIQQEINDLQEAGVELTQYNLDQLRAKYELRLAEIALEDAQNAKSQVRMTRDNDGNWSYTYTADQDNIDKAQQNYEDKLYAMQNLTSNYIETMQEQIMDLNSQMAQELAGVDKSLFATEEEYLEELNRIREYYAEKSNKLMDQINKALGDNRELYENDWKAYSEATGYKISANEDYIDSWNETQYALLSGYDTIEDYQRAFTTLLGSVDDENSLIGQMVSAYREWHSIVKEIEDSTGMGLDELLSQVGQITTETEKVKQETVELSKEMGEAWKNILADIQEFSKTLAKTIEDAVNGIETQVENLIKLIKSLYQQEVPGPTQLPGPNNASHYDTGGYTGSWGKNGKFAVLHEKELILDAEDTRNMLKGVGMTRDIAKQIELNAIAAGSGLSNFAPGSIGQFQQVEQNIVINAEFPTASNREEIAAAFDNLLNRASQYANRK